MKQVQLIKEANIGKVVELSNVELVLIKTKWAQITEALSKERKLDGNLTKNITDFSNLMDKICDEVISLDQASNELFSSEPITDDEMQEIVQASGSGIYYEQDDERAHRQIKHGPTDI